MIQHHVLHFISGYETAVPKVAHLTLPLIPIFFWSTEEMYPLQYVGWLCVISEHEQENHCVAWAVMVGLRVHSTTCFAHVRTAAARR